MLPLPPFDTYAITGYFASLLAIEHTHTVTPHAAYLFTTYGLSPYAFISFATDCRHAFYRCHASIFDYFVSLSPFFR